MGTSRTVTNEQIEQVIRLREEHGLLFEAIGAAMGDWSRQRASDIYHYYRGKNLPEGVVIRRPANSDDDSPIGGPGRVPKRVHPDFAIPAKVEPSPSARRYLASMCDDVLLRIQRQGITAGLFGDPPAGRSALDQKRAGIIA